MSKGDDEQLRGFVRALLRDLSALEEMLERGDMFETGVRRIGAEQEMFLVDEAMQPAPLAMRVLERLDDKRIVTELALFNLEANASPLVFGGDCLSRMKAELEELVGKVKVAAAAVGGDVVLTGILPTLRMQHLGDDNMTPKDRYHAIDRATREARGNDFDVYIVGIDELRTTHHSVMLESCNTSFQVHFQVAPDEFAELYNVAQVVTAPVLAAAANSALFLGKRLWNETRVALFERSVDSRRESHQKRGIKPRVTFGDDWVAESVLEIFREQVARFRVMLPDTTDEDPIEVLANGGVPRLRALCQHNGTVYRWNRACYGITKGVPHLRIENRALPAGPTIVDEVANATFFHGLMAGVSRVYPDVSSRMAFANAKENFVAAARYGLKAQFTWFDGATRPASELIVSELVPLAREGLTNAGVDAADIDHYLGIIEQRASLERNGARWMFASHERMSATKADSRDCALVAATLRNQQIGSPVHTWPLCGPPDHQDVRDAYRTVGQFMTTDLFTVRPEDLLDFAASVMDWKHVEHIPVEDHDGRLVGLITYRMLLRMVARGRLEAGQEVVVADIMREDPCTVGPDTPTLDAMHLMRQRGVGCLPVVEDGKLLGIITQSDLIEVSAGLLEKYLGPGD